MFKIDAQTGEITFPDGFVLACPYDGPRYASYVEWVQAGNQPEIVNGGPEVELEALKKEAKALVVQEAGKYGTQMTARYPLHEILSWPVKVAEARAIKAGEKDASQFPIIASECAFSGAAPSETADYILANSALYQIASGAISGIRQEAIRRIESAEDAEAVGEALQWASSAAQTAFSASGGDQ